VGRLPIRIALAAARALDPWTDGAVKVKWPNDLFLGVHKFGGILCEASWEGPRLDHVIVGIGLNLLQAEDEFPEPLRPLATSIRVFTGRSVSRFDVATAVISALRPFATGAHPLGPDRIVENFASRDYLNGRYVEILEPESGRSLAAGYANGIHADGALRVESPEGLVMVRSGTVRIGG
jgi:BirA family biotin operon repressor/biotin-[acetyl-CoA-carboxylase] ligase